MHRCVFRTFLKAVHMSAICTGIKEKVKVTPKILADTRLGETKP